MKIIFPPLRRLILLAAIAAVSVATSPCATFAATPLQAAVPADVKARGVLRVGSQQTFPPVEFREPGKEGVVGVSRDLLDEVGKRLNLKVEYVQAEYASLIPGLDAGRFDIASGGISDTEEREQKVDFVNYMFSGGSILMLSENKAPFATIDDFCGRTVVTMLGGRVIMGAVEAASARCVATGKQAIRADQLPSAPDARAQVDLKRADGYIGDLPALAYLSAQFPGKYRIVGGNYRLTSYITSWGFSKSNTALRDAVRATLQTMLDDGTYQRLLAKWSLAGAALPTISVNQPASKRK